MKCKYCGKEMSQLKYCPLNGCICKDCENELLNIMYALEGFEILKMSYGFVCLAEAVEIFEKWLDKEFIIYRMKQWGMVKKRKTGSFLRYIAVKQVGSVKFPVKIEVTCVNRKQTLALKIRMIDDTKIRDTYIYGDRGFKSKVKPLTVESSDIKYVKTDMSRVERELKEFLK